MRRRTWLFCMAAALATVRAHAQHAEHLQRIDDLRALSAEVARARVPLLVLFSTPGCPFCREVRRNYLTPRLTERPPAALIREVDIVSDRVFTDFDGQAITEQAFARRYGVRVVPVVTVVDARGALLDEPLVGLDRSGFYEGYLANMIDRAQRKLRP